MNRMGEARKRNPGDAGHVYQFILSRYIIQGRAFPYMCNGCFGLGSKVFKIIVKWDGAETEQIIFAQDGWRRMNNVVFHYLTVTDSITKLSNGICCLGQRINNYHGKGKRISRQFLVYGCNIDIGAEVKMGKVKGLEQFKVFPSRPYLHVNVTHGCLAVSDFRVYNPKAG